MTNVSPLWRAEPFSAAIGALLDPSAELLLTTRLDNDDALDRTAMAGIRAAVGDVVPEFLNFPEGFGLILTEGQPRIVRYTHRGDPFLSLVERVEITAGDAWHAARCRRACSVSLPGRIARSVSGAPAIASEPACGDARAT